MAPLPSRLQEMHNEGVVGGWCRWLSADGEAKVGPGWQQRPQEVLHLPGGEGIASLAAGLHSCAAITTSGRLYMWGCLVCKVRHQRCASPHPAHMPGLQQSSCLHPVRSAFHAQSQAGPKIRRLTNFSGAHVQSGRYSHTAMCGAWDHGMDCKPQCCQLSGCLGLAWRSAHAATLGRPHEVPVHRMTQACHWS